MKSTLAKALFVVFLAALWLAESNRLAAQSAGVLREVYSGITGTTVADLTNNVNFPNNPSTQEILTVFEAPTDVAEDYGQRLTAYVVPPTSGNYVFWIASDDNSTLFLSTDDTPAKKRVIASVPGWTNSRQWDVYAEQQSSAISLVGGQRYYIEALMKEGGGGDNLAVRWQLPNATIEEPIPNNRLQVFGLGPPQITQQPVNVTVLEGGSATFSVQLARAFGATYQWLRNGSNIPGGTNSSYTLSPAALGDSGALFRCFITNPQGNTNSNTATLTVQADTTPPTISSVGNLGDNTVVTVLFSEPVEAATATNPLSYSINNGVGVTAAAFAGDTRSVALTTSPLGVGTIYTLTVNNVRDRAAVPNTIAPNSQKTFTLDFTPLDVTSIRPGPEPIGPSSRRTGLTISEIMYHPTNRVDGKNVEFIEIYNSQPYFEDISGYRLSGTVDYTFPTNTTIAARGYLVVAPSPADVQSVYPIAGVLGGFTNHLSNGSGTIRLRNKQGAVLIEVNYSGDPPWPAAADGAGHSLVLARPSFGEGDPRAWDASDLVGGTPGSGETLAANPYRTILINEFLAHTDDPELDYIELYNYSAQAVNLGGCILTDDPATNRFVLPNVTIPARGFLVYNQTTMGFSLGAGGETIYLRNPAGTKILDAVRFEGQENGVATGRYPDGAPYFYRLQAKTPGTSNAKVRLSEVVINEIMFNPISGSSDDEFVELYNRTASAISLAGWRLRGGISFTFPTNAVLPANGYVVIANDVAHLLTNYTSLTTNNTFGNYGGSLGNRGDRLALSKPDQVISTNNGVVVTNTIHIVLNEVTYGEGGRWGKWADGGGSSLELIDPNSDNRFPSNWADSDETTKGVWTNIEFTGTLDNGNGGFPADTLHIGLLGLGECLIDNVEVVPSGGGNVVPNPTFEGGLTGWVPQGSHSGSTLENSGYTSSRSLHIRADSRCDTAANRVRAALATTLATGSTATLRAKFRWLRGSPEPLLRLKGNWLEATGKIAVPANLGTPGLPNSRRVTNAGPAIHDVTHSPVLPASGQAVTVSARVNDPNGLTSLVVKYRVDPSTNFASVSMTYNGAGLFSAQIPGQTAGTVLAYYLESTDNAASKTLTTFPDDAPTRECLVRFGEPQPSGTLGTYRLWLSSKTVSEWSSRDKLNNAPLDATFVYNNFRVIYNAGSLYSGSPFHMGGWNGPVNNLCDYVLEVPPDDAFLGATDAVLASVGNLDNDDAVQREQTAFWMMNKLNVPFNHRRFIHMYVNGVQRGRVFEDAQQPNSDLVDQWFPDDADGDLHKIEDWFEFNDAATSFSNTDATLQNFTTGGQKKLARYRWIWRKRASDAPSAYAGLYSLVDALNSPAPQPYTSLVESLVDTEEWMRIFAVEHIVGNWDSYGYNRGKNMYGYKPQHGKWNLLAWDIDFVLGSGSDGTTTDINPLTLPVNDPVMRTMLSQSSNQRAFWRALEDAVNGPLLAANVDPLLDAKYNALIANGISVTSPDDSLKTWIQDRRNYILGELATVAASFAITSNNGNNFSTNKNYISLSGTAPIGVKTIRINGIAYPVTWTSLTGWTLTFALGPGANSLTVAGYDLRGNPVGGASDTITITYTGAAELPQDFLLINEIMYNPAVPDSAFIEIFNKSAITAFDVSNFRINGADFAFPEGTVIQPGGFLVVVNDPTAFVATYGSSIPIAGVFGGSLDNGGETLRLVKPGATPAQDLLIDEVTYDDDPPWPTAADGFGPSLQLIDPAQDNNRVANWAAVTTNSTSTPQWQFVTATGAATSSRLYIYLDGSGDLYIDDLKFVAGSVPDVGTSYAVNGDFESAFPGPWNVSANLSGSTVSTSIKHSGNASLHIVSTAAGSSQGTSIWQDMGAGVVNGSTYTLSFWYLPSTNAGTLTIRLSGSGVRLDQNVRFNPASSSSRYTPGAPNSVLTSLATFPPVWLNEIQPNNVSGMQDNFGDRDPWVELYNSGTSAADLTGFYLSNNYTNLTRWAFPAGTLINPGQFRLVWLDNEPGETSGANLHANFRASSTNGSVVLTKVSGSVTSIVDYLNYAPVNNDRSYGAYPDGTPAKRRLFYFATPGATNNPGYPATPVYINEWMASNVGAAADPADGAFDDWFELYNSGPSPVDLSGFTLTDDLRVTNNWTIPNGTVIPAGGYLLVWADNETSQNGYGGPDLHAGFRLSGTGEAIGLYAPNGALVDSVTFGQQTNDVSQGRWPDGNSGQFYFMTTPTPRAANSIGSTGSNSPPVLAAIGNKSGSEGATITFTASATDPNAGQALTYSLDSGAPAGATINSSSGVFTWTPSEAQGPGVYSVTVRVTDNGSPALSDFETITITASEVNVAPAPAFISDKTVSEGSLLSFTASATDGDLPAQALAFSVDPGAPSGVTINSSSGFFTWTPTEAQGPGTYPVTVRVTDNGSPALSTAETFNITVTELNTAPVLATIGNKSVTEGSTLSFTLTATDSDLPAQTLTYSMDPGAPSGANFNASTRTFTWTPAEDQGPGTNTVTLRVTDNGSPALSDFETITIIVAETNSPPVLGAVGNKSVTEGSALSFTLTATDSDLPVQTLTYSMDAGAPTGANFNAATRTFTWTPAEDQGPGTNTVTFRVTDNGSPALSDFETITIIVTETNSPPVLGAIGDKTVDEGALLSFTATATDADRPNNTLTYSLDPGAPAGAGINPASGLFTWTPTESQGPGTNAITVRVTDNGSPAMSDAETITIVVREVNSPPVLAPVTNQTVTAGIQVTITNTAVDADLPANTLSFSLDTGAPGGASINPTSGVFTWTPASTQAPSTNLITVRVTDNGSPVFSDTKSFTVVVNSAAELRLTGITMASGGGTITLNWSSQAGKTYRVESKDDLSQPTWNTEGDFNATNSTTSATLGVNGAPRRYYRIEQVN